MLKFMRRHSKSTTIKILFWIIIAVFILWGVGSFRNEQPLYAASINGDLISPKEVRRAAQQLERFYRQIYGENFSPDLAKALDFKSRALDQIINTALLRQEGQRLGLSVSEEEIRAAIAGIEGLTVDGKFRRDVYFRFLRSQGLTAAEFETAQHDSLLVQKMRSVITRSIRPDEDAARAIYAFSNEKVNLSFLRVKAAGEAKSVTVTEDDTKAYFESHRESFREPQRASIDYLSYADKDFENSASVSDEELTAEYETFKQTRYTKPEEARARHILLRVPPGANAATEDEIRARAASILERLKKGEDFATLAKDLSEDPSNKDRGGDLGFFTRGQMEEAFESAAFALKDGEFSDVIRTRYGFHILRVEERRPERQQPFEEVRDSIARSLRVERARAQARDTAFADSQEALAGKSLEDIAKARHLELHSPPPFAENEGVVGLPQLPELVKSVFEAAAGQIGPVTQGPGIHVLFRMKEKIPSHVPDLQEIQARVEKALREEKGAIRAKERATELWKLATEKRNLEELEHAESPKVEETGPFTRTGDYVPKIGSVPGLKKEAFSLTPENPVASEVTVAGGDAFVVMLKEKTPADMAEFETKKDELVKRYLEDQREASLQALLDQLKKRASIQINQAALSSA